MTHYKPPSLASLTYSYDPVTQKVVAKDAVVLDTAAVPFIGANDYPNWLRESAKVEDRCEGSDLNSRPKFLRWLADQIAEQTRPAIEEPQGLGAVVETRYGTLMVRCVTTDDEQPWRDQDGAWYGWQAFDPVRVLSEGVKL